MDLKQQEMHMTSECAPSCASSCSRHPDAPLHAPPHAAGIQMRLFMRLLMRPLMQQTSRCASSRASSCSRHPDAPRRVKRHAQDAVLTPPREDVESDDHGRCCTGKMFSPHVQMHLRVLVNACERMPKKIRAGKLKMKLFMDSFYLWTFSMT